MTSSNTHSPLDSIAALALGEDAPAAPAASVSPANPAIPAPISSVAPVAAAIAVQTGPSFESLGLSPEIIVP